MNGDTPSTLPNPAVYLNYLDPYTALQYEVARNVFLATLGAFTWDILSCISNDWKLLRISKLQPAFFAYHLSRWGTFGFVLCVLLLYTGPVAHCQTIEYATTACCFVSGISSDFLFLARVRGVYYNNRIVCTMFFILWLADVALLCLLFPGIRAAEIADTKHCMNLSSSKYLAVTMLFQLFFDTMVYIFVTVKLCATRNPREKNISWRTVISGAALPKLSRAILLGGQQYYLIKIFVNVVMATFWLVPSMPPTLQASMIIPGVALTSSMACRVYRNLRLQILEDAPQGEEAGAVFTTCVQVPMSEGLATKDERAPNGGDGDLKLGIRPLQIVIATNEQGKGHSNVGSVNRV